MKLKPVWIALVILALSAALAFSQAVNGTLLGTITDASGATVPNAKVTITEANTGTTRTLQSNESGNYVFSDVPPGLYTVAVELTGFKRSARPGVELTINSSPRVDLVLQPGNVSESIEVTASTPLLQTDRADTGSQLTTVQTANLPLGTGRNYQNLLNLVPGTTRASYQHSQFFNAANSLQTQVNGNMRQGNNYMIEGVDNNQRTGLLQIMVPPIEAIQTVAVSTSNFDAELGRASGAVTNVQLKSGGNELHGSGYEFLRNSEFNARNFFDPSIGHQSYNYLGGNIGGAIIKNKLFFFGDYLRVWDHQSNTNQVSIPQTDLRTGNLSRSTSTIYDPASGAADGTGRTPFTGNIIPSSRINPISTKLLALVPQPNLGSGDTNNYFSLLPFKKDSDSFDYKMDWNISDKDRLTGRFSYARPVTYQAPIFGIAGGPTQGSGGGFAGTGIQKTYSAGLNYNRMVTNTLMTEVRIGVAHYNNVAQNSDYGTKASESLGIPGVNLDEYSSGIVGIIMNGGYNDYMIGYVNSLPWKRAEANIDVVNSWTKNLSNHTIKWGADIRRIRDELLQMQTFSSRGLYRFADGQTSTPGAKTSFMNNVASFLLDTPSQAGRDLATYFPAYRAWNFFFYAQDTWVVNPKLTVNIGLRYELYPPATPRLAKGFSNYNFVNNTLEVAGVGSVPMNLGIENHKNYIAPRTGIAYRFNDKTVVRTGFGISYTPFPDNSYAYNYPVRANNQFDPAVASYGAAVLPNGQTASFQNGFPAPIQVDIPTDGIIKNPPISSSYNVVNKSFKNPSVVSWNFAVQRQLPGNLVLDMTYVGSHGVNQVVNYNLNAGMVLGAGNNGRAQYPSLRRTADTNLLFAGFSTSYNALQVKLDRRFTNGVAVTTAYTYGKGMGFQTGDDGGPRFYINFRRNYSRNDFDRTHTFVQSYVYELPFGHGKRWLSSGIGAATLGGWRVNGVLTLMTGTPMWFGYSATNLSAPGNSQTPDIIAPIQILHGINKGNQWFSTSSFAAPVGAVFGNAGRNLLSGPGFFNLDASIFKTFKLTERMNLEVRGESFSVTNTPQFSNPNTTLGDANFGFVTGAGGARGLQLGLKLNF
ncbi:TonB-dependent receptor domain-containing protein [Paludibaculum fermentans]|uniref:TonB-dependent receptor n=1 Tax=Paludibaculum fermentans TaxID=1473598 RepID=UPI003EC02B2E